MVEILQFVQRENHEECNCILLAFICKTLHDDVWILDANQHEVMTLSDVIKALCGIPSLLGKPKIILLHDHRLGNANH